MATRDTIVVGAGPAGLLFALNYPGDVLVLEARRRIGEPPHCTGLVSLETGRLLPRDAWITVYNWMRVFIGNNVLDVRTRLVWLDRPLLDKLLAEMVKSRGVDVKTNCRVEVIERVRKGFTVHATCGTFHARRIVVAEGASRLIADKLGLPKPLFLRRHPALQYRVVNARIRDGVYAVLGLHGTRYAWIVCKERICLVGAAGSHARRAALALVKTVGGRIVETRGGVTLECIPPRRLCKGSECVIGDAACMVKSLTGGGLYAIARAVPRLARGDERAWSLVRRNLVTSFVLSKTSSIAAVISRAAWGVNFKLELKRYDEVRVGWLRVKLKAAIEEDSRGGFGT